MTAGGIGLSHDDLEREAARFGVADDQVRRDHAISHILARVSARMREDVLFFGGTALSRTHLVHARLSEDIDLIALGNRTRSHNDWSKQSAPDCYVPTAACPGHRRSPRMMCSRL